MTYPRRMITKTAFTPTGPSTYGSAPGIWRMDEVAYWQKQGVWPNPSIVPDTYFPYVSLLLSSTSLSNANNNLFVDSSGAFNPVSRNGNTTQGSFTPYGSYWSNYFDGSGDYLTAPSNAAFGYGTGDFTVEMWYYPQAFGTATILYDQRTSGATEVVPTLYTDTSSGTLYYYVNGANRITGPNLSLNTWQHIAVSRSGTSTKLFVNGAQVGSTYSDSNNYATSLVSIGTYAPSPASYYITGFVSNVRIVKGTAVYTSAFTPPTAPLTAISGTSLLTCQSNRFIDNSSNAFTITVNGDTKVQKFSPFSSSTYTGISYNQSDITNWSGYFDGSGDYLTTPTLATIGSGNFSQEAWVFASSTSGTPLIWDAGAGAGTFLLINGTTSILGGINGTTALTATYTLPTNQWTHLVYCRSGTTLSIYANGTRIATGTVSTSAASGSYNIGAAKDATRFFTGYISNLRFVTGSSAYDATQATITVPTTSLTAISGTSLLTLQNAAFTDNSTNNFVITQNGNPTVSGNSPFNTTGYWSNYTSGGYLSWTNSTGLGSNNFTIEFWGLDISGSGNWGIFSIGATSGADFAGITLAQNGGVYISTTGSSWQYTNIGGLTFSTDGQWHHYAIVRNGGSLLTFKDGTLVATTAISGTIVNNSGHCRIASKSDASGSTTGYFSNFRVVNGTALYTASFTVPTAPLTAVANTAILTCQNGRFIDNSTNAFTITVNGNTSVQSYNPFYTATIASNGGSMYFDGSGDYLTLPYSGNMQYSGNFTIECWVYPTARLRLYPCIFSNYNSFTTNGSIGIFAGHNSSSTTKYQIAFNGTFPFIQSTADIVYGAWAHIALVRVGSTITLYINGVANGTGTSSATVVGTANNWWVGVTGDAIGNAEFNGYISNLRAVPSAVYTAAFTPPTAPVTPTAATTLLLNGMNAGAYDATAINDMETVGNAQVSTVQSKFGGSSMYFDGSGDYLATQGLSANFAFGTGDFTIEMWIYFNDVTSLQCFYDPRPSGTQGAYPVLYVESGTLRLNSNTTDLITTSVSTGQWYHIAVSRSGSTTRMFKDGVSVGTYGSLITYLNGGAGRPGIGGGGYSTSTFFLNGYIDDLRITKGVARYTANFTPPTQAFPVY